MVEAGGAGNGSRSGLVGVSLCCFDLLGIRSQRQKLSRDNQRQTRARVTVVVAVVCNGEDEGEDGDGKDGEKGQGRVTTRVRSNKTRGAQTLRRSSAQRGLP